jgi:hypothetical protein
MKLRLLRLKLAATAGGKVTLRIPAHERKAKTSHIHISLVRHSYISGDADVTERYDAN